MKRQYIVLGLVVLVGLLQAHAVDDKFICGGAWEEVPFNLGMTIPNIPGALKETDAKVVAYNPQSNESISEDTKLRPDERIRFRIEPALKQGQKFVCEASDGAMFNDCARTNTVEDLIVPKDTENFQVRCVIFDSNSGAFLTEPLSFDVDPNAPALNTNASETNTTSTNTTGGMDSTETNVTTTNATGGAGNANANEQPGPQPPSNQPREGAAPVPIPPPATPEGNQPQAQPQDLRTVHLVEIDYGRYLGSRQREKLVDEYCDTLGDKICKNAHVLRQYFVNTTRDGITYSRLYVELYVQPASDVKNKDEIANKVNEKRVELEREAANLVHAAAARVSIHDSKLLGQNNAWNGVKDGIETDIDCGGEQARQCDDNAICGKHEDCLSHMCVNNRCKGTSAAANLTPSSITVVSILAVFILGLFR